MLYSMCKAIGERVKEHRNLLGYTQEQFAEKLDISLRFVADIELGKKGMSIDTLIKMCTLLSVSADYLIWGKDEKSEKPENNLAALTKKLSEDEMKHAEDLMRTFVKAISEEKLKKLQ